MLLLPSSHEKWQIAEGHFAPSISETFFKYSIALIDSNVIQFYYWLSPDTFRSMKEGSKTEGGSAVLVDRPRTKRKFADFENALHRGH